MQELQILCYNTVHYGTSRIFMYLKRIAEERVLRYLNLFPVLGLTGPRQSGKSTLLRHLLPGYRYVTFDDFQLVEFFNHDPKAFLNQYDNDVIFDEVQLVPELFSYIKIAVDNDRERYGKYILTGSSQFSYLKKASESLAGRIGLMSLLPLQYKELPQELRQQAIFSGSYPELVVRHYKESSVWYASYLETYLNKDVSAITHIGDMRDFRRFIQLLAARTGQLFDQTYFSKDLGVSVPTIKRWISVLEASYIVFLLPSYHTNFGKRLIKTPKIYFYDTGLVSYLTGIETQELYEKGPMAGALFENYIVSEVLKKIKHEDSHNEIFYLRTGDKAEIDLIVDKKISQDFIEIKKSATFNFKMASTLKQYCSDTIQGYVLYNGERLSYQPNIEIMPFEDYLL